MSVSLLGRTYPLYLIGESHAIAFGGELFRSDCSQEVFLCHTQFLTALKSEQYLDANGQLHPWLINLLKLEKLLDESGMPNYLIDSMINSSSAYISATPLMPPAIVLFGGDMSLHEIFPSFSDYDFMLPNDTLYGFDDSKKMLSFEIIRRKAESILAPFLKAASILRKAGFTCLMIHALPPRTTNDVKAARFKVGHKVRAKITVAANRIIADFCKKSDIGYIDPWDELAKDGFLREEFDLDGVHLTKPSVPVSLDKILNYLFDHSASAFSPMRYQLAIHRGTPSDPRADTPHDEEWKTKGWLVEKLGEAFVEPFAYIGAFDINENTLARIDWCGCPRAGRLGIAMAKPTLHHLQAAEKLFSIGSAYDVFRCGSPGELTISSFRPVRVSAPATEPVQLAPPGARKAVVHLNGEGALQLTSVTGELIEEVRLQSGIMIVYDPSRVQCRYVPDGAPIDLIEMGIIPRIPGHPFRVIWAGFNDWPVDIFCHSVNGMTAFPAFGSDFFNERAYPHPFTLM